MKYVIATHNDTDEVILVFSDAIIHRAAAGAIRQSALEDNRMGWKQKLISAGMFKIVDGKVQTHGYSESLNLSPRPEDAEILARHLGLTA